jgi:hypothetical protein
LGSSIGNIQPIYPIQGDLDYNFNHMDVQLVSLFSPFYTPWLRSYPNSIIGLVTPDMLDSITWGTYIFFASFCLLAVAFTYFWIPETRGKVSSIALLLHSLWMVLTRDLQTLEDMDLIFGDTAAHEEKERIKEIEARLRGAHIADVKDDLMKPEDQHIETV